MFRWMGLTLPLVLAACSTATHVKFDLPAPPSQAAPLSVQDLRPAGERQPTVVRDRAGESTCLGDASFLPAPPAVVGAWASAFMSPGVDQNRLELHAFRVCILNPNAHADSEKTTATLGAGLSGAMTTGVAIAVAPLVGAGLTSLSFAGDRTVDVRVDVTLNGQRIQREAAKSFSYGLNEDELRSTINEALNRLAAEYQEKPR
ncbi:MAG: hypothetical protein GAK30_03244 [Paracidovorax wautersii]|uniref:Lipoprotein n=1 Tax=Paracidovorax wautersii TaxID=1177982 RepID=A0A7V8FLF2_9BURK|nr:MAG: hypothetical protein GAK30_03244 [Paracidovorax wautersii]